MFKAEEIKQNLIGCAEIMLFMNSGVDRFQHISIKDAIKSFIVPLFILPLALVVLVLTSNEGYSVPYLVSVHAMRIIAGMALYILVVYVFCKLMERRKHFTRYIVVANWMGVLNIVLLPPILFYALSGADIPGIESYAVFTALAGYVYLGFVLTFSLRIPWEMGGFMAVVGILVDETMWDILYYFCGDITAISGT